MTIRVSFIIERPARANPDFEDAIEVFASVDLASRTATITGASVERGGTIIPPYPLSVAELEFEGLRLDDLRILALEEAAQSGQACAHCAKAEAVPAGSLCGDCTAQHGELPAAFAAGNAATLVRGLSALFESDPVLRSELVPLLTAARALFDDASARSAAQVSDEEMAAQ